jgi:hypothetical protein
MKQEYLQILTHSLGTELGKAGMHTREFYRNRFVAGDSHSDMPLLLDLVAAGYMGKSEPQASLGNARVFWVTEKGISLLLEENKKQLDNALKAYWVTAADFTIADTVHLCWGATKGKAKTYYLENIYYDIDFTELKARRAREKDDLIHS